MVDLPTKCPGFVATDFGEDVQLQRTDCFAEICEFLDVLGFFGFPRKNAERQGETTIDLDLKGIWMLNVAVNTSYFPCCDGKFSLAMLNFQRVLDIVNICWSTPSPNGCHQDWDPFFKLRDPKLHFPRLHCGGTSRRSAASAMKPHPETQTARAEEVPWAEKILGEKFPKT